VKKGGGGGGGFGDSFEMFGMEEVNEVLKSLKKGNLF